MKMFDKGVFLKIWTEPPIAAAFITVVFFSLPVFVSIVFKGSILLPKGYTYLSVVKPVYGFIAIVIDLLLVYLFSQSPVIKLKFHLIVAPDIYRKALIIIYIIITWISFFAINAKLDLINSLLDDPILAMLNAGGGIIEENLLRSFFFGLAGCIAYSLTNTSDGIFLKAISFFTILVIVVFYFFIGRREISVMTLCFLLLVKRDKIGKVYLIAVSAIVLVVLVSVLSLRLSVQDNSDPLYATDSEELSTVAYSAYVIQTTTPNIFNSVTEVTPLRPYLYPNTISATYVKNQTGYNDVSVPVLGIGGITYMYGFILPVIMLIILGSLFRSINHEFNIKKTAVLKLLLIFVTFKAFNLFRNGEFPIVIFDVIKFLLLSFPALYLTFKKSANLTSYE